MQFKTLLDAPLRTLEIPQRLHPSTIFLAGCAFAAVLGALALRLSALTLDVAAYVTAFVLLAGSWYLAARLATKTLSSKRALERTSLILERTRDLQNYLAKINQAASDMDDEQTFLDAVCRMACEQAGLHLAEVSVPNADGVFEFRASFGKTDPLQQLRLCVREQYAQEQGPVGQTWRSGRALFNSELLAAETQPWHDKALSFGLQASATLPLYRQGRIWGVLSLYRGDDIVFDAPMRTLLLELAHDVSRGLDLVDKTQRLKVLDRAVGALSEGLTISDASRRLIFVNPAFERITGFSAQEALGRNCAFLQTDKTDRAVTHVLTKNLSDGHGFNGEILNMRKDGTEFWNHLHIDAVRDARGQVTHFVGVQRDVTQQKQVLDLQHALLENSAAGVLIARDQRIIAMNSTLGMMVGRDPATLCGQNTRFLYDSPQEYERVGEAYKDLTTLETTSVSNVRLQRHDGQFLLCDLYGRILPDGLTTVWTYTDVTERESRAQALKRAQRVYLALAASAESLLMESGEGAMLSRLCQQLLCGTEFSSICVACPDELQSLHSVAFASSNPAALACLQVRAINLCDEEEACARAWTSSESVLLHKSKSSHAPDDWVLAVAVERAGKPWGVIEFSAAREDVFDEATRQGCQQVAALLGHGLDELDRKNALQALQDAERLRARTDALTGLPNRLAFEEYLPRAIARADRHKTFVAVGMLDLDDFKPVNDQYGHQVGDVLLRKVAQALNERMRSTDFLARIGGDEFVLIFEDISPERAQNELETALRRLHNAVETTYSLGEGRTAQVGMTVGVAVYPQDAEQPHALLRMADSAMYRCKGLKIERDVWWQLCSQGDERPSAGRESSNLDPFDSASQEVLAAVDETIYADVRPAFVRNFDEELLQDARHVKLLELLRSGARARLHQVILQHLESDLAPQQTREMLCSRAESAGTLHALIGVQGAMVERTFDLFEDLLRERLDRTTLGARTKHLALRIIRARLRLDVQCQIDAMDAVRRRYDSALQDPISLKSRWVDILPATLDGLSRLPGIRQALLFRPNEDGVMRIEAGAGQRFEEICLAMEQPHLYPTLNALREGARGPLAQAWFDRQTHVVTATADEPRLERWNQLAKIFGWKSMAAVPISNEDSTDSVLVLTGEYPGQFSSWSLSWLETLRTRMDTLLAASSKERVFLEPAQVRSYREMLYGGGLQMWLQPLVDLQSGEVRKAEALARLTDPAGKILAPGQFLPAFGEQELHALFRQGLAKSLDLLQGWRNQGIDCEVSVNLSPVTLAHPECVSWIGQALARAKVDPGKLTLEVLETADIDPVYGDRTLHAIHALGVRLALDDLGSGYSNLTRLASLPIDTVKIDQSLVKDLPKHPLKTMRLLSTMVSIGHDFAQTTVLEGLEDKGCVEAAQILGAHLGQGYELARPMPAKDFEAWVLSWGLDPVSSRLQTWMGAFAYQWNATRETPLRNPALELSTCPLGDFLREHGLENSEPMEWLQASRAETGAKRAAAAEALLMWLAGKVRKNQGLQT